MVVYAPWLRLDSQGGVRGAGEGFIDSSERGLWAVRDHCES